MAERIADEAPGRILSPLIIRDDHEAGLRPDRRQDSNRLTDPSTRTRARRRINPALRERLLNYDC
jgi:hypothetical protein